jgi:hypothetical protein
VYWAQKTGILDRPAKIISFDRHKDSLIPTSVETLSKVDIGKISDEELIGIFKGLSARDDDWIIAGMELGLISEVMQFGSLDEEKKSETTKYTDSRGKLHRIFHLGRPCKELSHKGVLADEEHDSVKDGMWELFGWKPSITDAGFSGKYLLDIDLDFFTFGWDRYTFPFNKEIYEGEFLSPCSSQYGDTIPAEFVRKLARDAGLVTMAAEPHFCGGKSKSKSIFTDINYMLFEGNLPEETILDYPVEYPCME